MLFIDKETVLKLAPSNDHVETSVYILTEQSNIPSMTCVATYALFLS